MRYQEHRSAVNPRDILQGSFYYLLNTGASHEGMLMKFCRDMHESHRTSHSPLPSSSLVCLCPFLFFSFLLSSKILAFIFLHFPPIFFPSLCMTLLLLLLHGLHPGYTHTASTSMHINVRGMGVDTWAACLKAPGCSPGENILDESRDSCSRSS